VRLRSLEENFEGSINIIWKAFLLRPEPQKRDLKDFVEYTKSWNRPAKEDDSGHFKIWNGADAPLSYSVPPHIVGKAAARFGRDKFLKIHDLLLDSYFSQSLDISSEKVLRSLWEKGGLDLKVFPSLTSKEIVEEIMSDHREAIEFNVGGVPAIRYEQHDVCVVGAQPLEVYKRWFGRLISQSNEG